MASNKNGITTPDLPTLQTSLSRLTTAAHILDGFAHRNKNQHRGTRWWGPFGMLRANIRKVLPDLESAVQRAELLSSSALPGAAAKRRKTEGGGRVAVRQPELDKVVERAQWVHDVVGAKAYEAFTQVAADRQFAQLGLVLIGVLAQVEAAIAPFVQVEPDTGPADELGPAGWARAVGAKGDASLATGIVNPTPNGGDDLGVAISRDELDDDDVRSKDEKPLPPTGSSSRNEEKSSIPKPEKPKSGGSLSRNHRDTESQRIGPKDGKKVKKKKKKKGGDEFDDLFSSLT